MNNFFLRLQTSFFLTLIFFFCCYMPPVFFAFLLLLTLFLILLFEWPRIIDQDKTMLYITPLYPMMPFFVLIMLLFSYKGKELFIILTLFVVTFDAGSYIFGKTIGKTTFLPFVSPKKTVEGVLGGFFSVFCLAFFFVYFFNIYNFFSFFFYIFILAIMTFLGDLFESWIKRRSQIKDSGDILPGHGGLLDRFDAILFAGIYFYLIKSKFLFFIFF